MVSKAPRYAIFISGRGSTLQAALDMRSQVSINLVVSSKTDVWGLVRARRAGVPTLCLAKKIDWQILQSELRRHGITDIFLLGFMRIIPADFLQEWGEKIYNLHPSLLPKYPGTHAIEKSFADGSEMGASVHNVIAELDAGGLRLQQSIGNPSDLEWAKLRIAFSEQFLVRTFLSRRGLHAAGF